MCDVCNVDTIALFTPTFANPKWAKGIYYIKVHELAKLVRRNKLRNFQVQPLEEFLRARIQDFVRGVSVVAKLTNIPTDFVF